MLDEQRAMWLTGGGGGGLPLPLAFSTVVEEVLDHQYASFEKLEKVLSEALTLQIDRILASPFKTWGSFTLAVLEQLESIQVLRKDDVYVIGAEFQPGVRITAIPKTDVWFQVWNKDDRVKRENDERLLMNVRQIIAGFALLDRFADEDVSEAGVETLKRFREIQQSAVQEERLLTAGKETGSLGLLPQRERVNARKPGNRYRPPKPMARELALQKYGLDGNSPANDKVLRFEIDGKRECSACHHRRLPEDFEVYTDGKGVDWFLRGTCRGCQQNARAGRVRNR